MNDLTRKTLRRRLGLGMAIAGVLVIVGGSAYALAALQPASGGSSAAEVSDTSSLEPSPADSSSVALPSSSEATPTPDAVPTDSGLMPLITPAEYANIDFSKTPAGWYDARTPSSDVVIPEVNAWGEPSTGVWEKQREISAQCMAEQGFWFAWTNDRSKLEDPLQSMFIFDDSDAARLAHWGTNPSDQPYDWRLAGCDGYAVHVTGMDDAH